MEYYRKCPLCEEKITYANQSALGKASRENRKCKTCAVKTTNRNRPKKLEGRGEAILQLIEEGLSTNAMSKRMGVSRNTMAKYLSEDMGKIVFEAGPIEPIIWVSENSILCKMCSLAKDVSQFRLTSRGKRSGSCKVCLSARELRQSSLIEVPWGKRIYRSRRRAVKIELDFDLDMEYLEWLWLEQSGKCVYTCIDLYPKPGKGHHGISVSIERINKNSGYVKGNVVLVSRRANAMKSDMSLEEFKLWMPLWYGRMVEFTSERKINGWQE